MEKSLRPYALPLRLYPFALRVFSHLIMTNESDLASFCCWNRATWLPSHYQRCGWDCNWVLCLGNVYEKWHLFKKIFLKLTKEQSLLDQSHVQQILYVLISSIYWIIAEVWLQLFLFFRSLSHILLLKP